MGLGGIIFSGNVNLERNQARLSVALSFPVLLPLAQLVRSRLGTQMATTAFIASYQRPHFECRLLMAQTGLGWWPPQYGTWTGHPSQPRLAQRARQLHSNVISKKITCLLSLLPQRREQTHALRRPASLQLWL